MSCKTPPCGAVVGEIAVNLIGPVGTTVTLAMPRRVESILDIPRIVTIWGVVVVIVDGVAAVGTLAGAV